MDLDELVDKYRGAKKQVRFGLVALVSLLPALNEWFTSGEILEGQRVQIESELSAATEKFNAAKSKIAELPALLTKLTEIEGELVKAREILPERVEFDSILSALGGLEKDFGVTIAKFTPGQEVQPNPQLEYKEVNIDLELRGDFGSTMRFLDRLVHMPNLTNIRNIQFTARSNSKPGENPILDSKAKLILFKGM
jgi:Tfp pilus assembly protein PilO